MTRKIYLLSYLLNTTTPAFYTRNNTLKTHTNSAKKSHYFGLKQETWNKELGGKLTGITPGNRTARKNPTAFSCLILGELSKPLSSLVLSSNNGSEVKHCNRFIKVLGMVSNSNSDWKITTVLWKIQQCLMLSKTSF